MVQYSKWDERGRTNLGIYEQLPEALLPWYEEHKRDLPWRADREPYHVWLSEIMLQQTRVEAVKGYYARFLEALPDIPTLAKAEDDVLQKLWEGLGYYSRVRNLKKAAQVLMADFGGQFPKDYAQVLSLPGIGPYTAGAICSIAFDLPTPAVDGNVLRLAARLTADETPVDLPQTKRKVESALAAVYPPQAGMFTQALMELGATLCGPDRTPACEQCPCRAFCLGRAEGKAASLPVRLPKRARREERKTVFLLRCGQLYALERRDSRGLLAGLWQAPNCPDWLEPAQAIAKVEEMGLKPVQIYRQVEKEHIFTHIQWHMRGYYLEVAAPDGPYTWLTKGQIEESAALPTAFRQFFEEWE